MQTQKRTWRGVLLWSALVLLAGCGLWRVCSDSLLRTPLRIDDVGRSPIAPVASQLKPRASAVDHLPAEPSGLPARQGIVSDKTHQLDLASAPSSILGRCVDVYGSPLENVQVSLLPTLKQELTGADGVFRFGIEKGLVTVRGTDSALRVRAAAAGFQLRELELSVDEPVDLGDIVLIESASVAGEVLSLSGGALPNARVVAYPYVGAVAERLPVDALRTAMTGRDGEYELRDMPLGRYLIIVQAAGYQSAERVITLQSQGAQARESWVLGRLQGAGEFRIRVVDAEGLPAPGTAVQYWYWGSAGPDGGVIYANEEGRVALAATEFVEHYFVAIAANGERGSSTLAAILPSEVEHVLALKQEKLICVRAVGHAGEPLRGCTVEIRSLLPAPAFWSRSDRQRKGRVGGSPRVDMQCGDDHAHVLVPADAFELLVRVSGYDVATVGPLLPEDVPSQLEVKMQLIGVIAGTVTDVEGRPLEGASLTLHRAIPEGRAMTIMGLPARSESRSVGMARSGLDGRFIIVPPGSGSYYCRAELDGFAPEDAGPLMVAANRFVGDVQLRLGAAGGIVGRVRGAKGVAWDRTRVRASRGDGFVVQAGIKPTGDFRLSGLASGEWLVVAGEAGDLLDDGIAHMADGSVGELPWNCLVVAGVDTYLDVDYCPYVLSGALSVVGLPRAKWHAVLMNVSNGVVFAESYLPEDGSFRLCAPREGDYVAVFSTVSECGGDVSVVFTPKGLEMRPELTVRLASGSISGEFGPSATAESNMHVEWSDGAGLKFIAQACLLDSGRFIFQVVPAGAVTLTRYSVGGEAETINVEVRAGSSVSVDLP